MPAPGAAAEMAVSRLCGSRVGNKGSGPNAAAMDRPRRGEIVKALLRLSGAIDWFNEKLGFVTNLLVLLAVVVSAGNAMSRYAFNLSSNGWLEVQWYMFAVIVMYGASYTLRRNEHVRVEIFYLMLSEPAQLWLDLICTILFLLPLSLLPPYPSSPFFPLPHAPS